MHKPTIAVIAAAAVLTFGVGGGAYAAGRITGADIKNDTVTTADIQDHTLLAKDLDPSTFKGRVLYSQKASDTWLGPNFATAHSIKLPAGKWLVSVTANAFPHNDGTGTPWADCALVQFQTTSSETSTTIAGSDSEGYATLATQLLVQTSFDDTVEFKCRGTNAGVGHVTLAAVEASSITDLSP